MIRYFTNRALSEKLGHNLAKWKRWSREFLPPDPLGGMQSGYARQYTPDQAFTVCLGGHLVADLHFSVPGARQILKDLQPWQLENGFCFRAGAAMESVGQTPAQPSPHYLIYIAPLAEGRHAADDPLGNAGHQYLIRGILSAAPAPGNGGVREERVRDTWMPDALTGPRSLLEMSPATLINMTALLRGFVERLRIPPASYGALS